MTEPAIRRAGTDEFDALGALWFASARAAHPYLPMLQALSEAEAVAAFRRFAGELELWVEVQDGVVQGLLVLDGPVVDRLYVAPAAQGAGVGSRLLAHAKALHPQGLSLYTHQKNARARVFYEARGFRPARFGISPAPELEPDVEYRWAGAGG